MFFNFRKSFGKNNSFNEYLVKKDRDLILHILKTNGFYFAKINSNL